MNGTESATKLQQQFNGFFVIIFYSFVECSCSITCGIWIRIIAKEACHLFDISICGSVHKFSSRFELLFKPNLKVIRCLHHILYIHFLKKCSNSPPGLFRGLGIVFYVSCHQGSLVILVTERSVAIIFVNE